MCSAYKVSKSGYYNWTHSKPFKREKDNKEITARIIAIHNGSNKTYGSPMITMASLGYRTPEEMEKYFQKEKVAS